MRRNYKLLEALGLGLALLTWALDWWLVQSSNQVVDALKRQLIEMQAADLTQQQFAKIRSESAFSRALVLEQIRDLDLEAQYAAYWRNPDSRLAWLDASRWSLTYFHNVFKVVDRAATKHDIQLSNEYVTLRSAFILFIDSFAKRYAQYNVDGRAGIPPSQQVATLGEVNKVSRLVDDLHRSLPLHVNAVFTELKERADSRSLIYRALFALGALMTVIAKTFEWWYGRQDA